MRRALKGPAVASRCPTAGAPLPPRPRGLPGPRVPEGRGGGKGNRGGRARAVDSLVCGCSGQISEAGGRLRGAACPRSGAVSGPRGDGAGVSGGVGRAAGGRQRGAAGRRHPQAVLRPAGAAARQLRGAGDGEAAGAIRPLVSTVIASGEDGCLDHSLERARYRASEMPQAFLFDIIYQAYQQCTDHDLDYGTECLHLALKYCKTNAKLVEGTADLWKVTYKRDLYAAESIIKDNLSQQICIITDLKEAVAQVGFLLHESLKSQVKVEAISISLSKNDSHLQNIFSGECYNFLCINDKEYATEEIQQLVDMLEKSNIPLLYPIVLILVHLSISENIFFSIELEELTKIKKFAREVKKKNILVYGLLIQCKDHFSLQETVNSAAALTMALIKDRNPELIGQLLVA
uniref:CDP-L-ribitol pyrophosphorylase A n=1 Tax=Cairina moschata TaxID=8855 RepID=A0A8C3C818_CAIMO